MRFIEDVSWQITGDLVAPTDIRLWNGANKGYWLQFRNVNGLTVEGGGSLDGQGASWWTCKKNQQVRICCFLVI
jgi:polygalacturonase